MDTEFHHYHMVLFLHAKKKGGGISTFTDFMNKWISPLCQYTCESPTYCVASVMTTLTIPVVLFHSNFSPIGEQLEHRKLVHDL